MSPQTVEDIRKIEDRLANEIRERQALIEAYRIVREDMSRQQGTNGTAPDDNAHPNLLLVPHNPTERAYGENTRLVKSAIAKMPTDYTIRDIHRCLRTFGYQLGMNAVATVLTRLKKNGEIEEIEPGRGQRPAVFKKVI
jgi:hypothetical protein